MQMGDYQNCIKMLDLHCIIKDVADTFKHYETKHHDVHNRQKRKDKDVKDNDGNGSVVPVSRLSLPIQKRIVLVAAAFLGTPCMEATPAEGIEQDMYDVIEKIWNANKLDYKFKKTAKITMSERQCAELWYTQDVDESYYEGFTIDTQLQMSMKLLAHSLGDTLYPVFDEFDNMIAFGRGYKVRTPSDDGTRIDEIAHLDIYTADEIYVSKFLNSQWLFGEVFAVTGPTGIPVLGPDKNQILGVRYTPGLSSLPNTMNKIPVVYYSQPLTEWHDVQELIDRLEKKISNHADTNDYFDSPIVVASGDVTGFSDKGEQGKLLQAVNGATVNYLTWNQAPESMKLEMDNLQKFIYSFTHTPDISFEQMKGLGTFSGIAIKMLFLDAHLKASDHEETFGEGIQRRINYLKHAVSVLDPKYKKALGLDITPKFEYFQPQNIAEQMDILVKAYGSDLLSQKTAITLNPLVSDPDAELDQIQTEGPVVVDAAPIPVR